MNEQKIDEALRLLKLCVRLLMAIWLTVTFLVLSYAVHVGGGGMFLAVVIAMSFITLIGDAIARLFCINFLTAPSNR